MDSLSSASDSGDAWLARSVAPYLSDAEYTAWLGSSRTLHALARLSPSILSRNYVFDNYRVMHSVLTLRRNTLLTGMAGTGKSRLCRRIIWEAQAAGLSVACTGMTGMAVLQLPPGSSTLHHYAGLGLGIEGVRNLVKRWRKSKRQSEMFAQWRGVDLLVVDEASRWGVRFFELVERSMRLAFKGAASVYGSANGGLARLGDQPFGGVQLLVIGDWLQLGPVGDTALFASRLWAECRFHAFELTYSHRQSTDPRFRALLSRVRLGEQTEDDERLLQARHEATLEMDWAGFVPGSKPVQLFPFHAQVSAVNQAEFDSLPGAVVLTSLANDSVWEQQPHPRGPPRKPIWVPSVRLTVQQALAKIGKDVDKRVAPVLQFKEDSKYLLTENVDVADGWVNGTVAHFRESVVAQHHKLQRNDGGDICLHELMRQHSFPIDGHAGLKLVRKQYCLRLAYAATIHSQQGVTLERVTVSLGRNVAAAGQAYTALARCRTLDGVHLAHWDARSIRVCPRAKRFYQQIAADGAGPGESKRQRVAP